MKKFSKNKLDSAKSTPEERLGHLANGLAKCIAEFSQENGPTEIERTVRLAFGNSVYLAIHCPDEAVDLLDELHEAGVAWDRESIVSAFRGYDARGDWVGGSGDLLATLWGQREGNSGPDNPDADISYTLFGIGAGLLVAEELPEIAKEFRDGWSRLNEESRYLVTRLLAWRSQNWQPTLRPFVEFAAGYYTNNSRERALVVGALAEVLIIATALADPWSLGLWSDTGWFAGRQVALKMPDEFRALIAEVPPNEIAAYLNLYRRCIVGTAASDGTVRPEMAALCYFGVTARDVYARAYCCGDQPRFVARAAYDFTFWMGLLSIHPIEVRARGKEISS